MVTIRSTNELILGLIDFFKLVSPDADTKPGTVIRNLFIDAPANQVALLYDELSKVSTQQSFRLVIGADLDKLAKNFGLTRKSATSATGVALLTFSSIPAVVNINKGDLITASNGLAFAVLNGLSVSPALLNFYKSTATKYRNDLDFLGITDQYAVEVTVQATSNGTAGNISKYSINRTSIGGVSNATNVVSFSGGSNQEDDATFRNRILAIFSGSSVGTALGYRNTALSTEDVQDAVVVGPGSPLMTRDGTIAISDNSGNLTIISEGSGGKVDIYILGSNLVQNNDSFIYHDLSNNNDPTSPKNNFVLGQIAADVNKTITQKRIDDIANGALPTQPVDSIIQVSGSRSGSNFTPKSVDQFGRVSGNFELVKDTGIYNGSPWASDLLAWVSDRISGFSEDKIKGSFDGQDAATFSDVLEIPNIQQNISITNENSTVLPSNRSLIQLLHTPATSVTRVFNVNTGERYTITNQNPEGTGTTNTSGVIQISGNTLPSPNDTLQVDYTWIVSFDQYSDYDGLSLTHNLRSVTDSIDWGYSNLIRNEKITFSKNGTFFTGTSSLPINSVISAKTFLEADGYVSTVTSGAFAGRLSVTIGNLTAATTSIDSIVFKNTQTELYVTAENNGFFSNTTVVVGILLEYVTTIILPTDTQANVGDHLTVILNSTDVYNITNSTGSFNTSTVTIPSANIITTANNLVLFTSYIANVQNIITNGISSLPASRIGNGFFLQDNVGFNNVNVNNISRREFEIVQKNLSNQFYIELNLISTDVSFDGYDVLSVIRLLDGKELWNADNIGTITTNDSNNNYQIILNGYNNPAIGNRVLVIYKATDADKFQPFTFQNEIIERDLEQLQYDSVSNSFLVDMHAFINESGLRFEILEPHTDIILASGSDGYVIANSPTNTALFGSASVNFGNLVDANSFPLTLPFKQLRILNATNTNNSNIYNIYGYNVSQNELTISNDFSQISKKQISIIRVLDGKELWSDNGTIDLINNKLSFPASSNATVNDLVFITYYNANNLKQAPTKLSLTTTDQVINTGVISISGTTILKAKDIVFTATTNGIKQSIFEAMRDALNLSSSASIPNNVKIAKLAKLEKVATVSSSNNEVVETILTYDTFGTTIQDNSFYLSESSEDLTLGALDFILPSTGKNTLSTNLPRIGDKLRITFYYATTGDTENVAFTRNGTLYTNKQFATIDRIYLSSGFNASQSTTLTINNFNQPITGSRYTTIYDYLAPKPNERITITYNYNKVISDATFNVESSRPIDADVLLKEATTILVDVTMNIVISPQSLSTATLVLQNVKNALTSAINATSLGTNLDASSLINTAFSVSGVSGARLQYFNRDGNSGQVLNIQAQANEFLVANNILVNQVSS